MEEARRIIDKLRVKYKQASTEVKDIQEEHEYQKEELLETVREQAQEVEFCHEIIKAMLRDYEL